MSEKKMILSIDDDQLMLKNLTAILSPAYDLRIAKCAADALNLLDTLKPDLILLDIEMPDISGFEFFRGIRKNPKFMKTPVIVITGHSESSILERAEKLGASSVITKPVDKDDLFQKIKHAFENPPKGIFML